MLQICYFYANGLLNEASLFHLNENHLPVFSPAGSFLRVRPSPGGDQTARGYATNSVRNPGVGHQSRGLDDFADLGEAGDFGESIRSNLGECGENRSCCEGGEISECADGRWDEQKAAQIVFVLAGKQRRYGESTLAADQGAGSGRRSRGGGFLEFWVVKGKAPSAPASKLQRNSKHQTATGAVLFGAWTLGFGCFFCLLTSVAARKLAGGIRLRQGFGGTGAGAPMILIRTGEDARATK